MDATKEMKKAIAERKARLAESLNVLDAAIKESQESRHIQMEEQHRPE